LPLFAITGTVIMNTGAGNDVVNIDGGRGALPKLTLDLGTGVDTLGIARDMSYNIWNLTGTQSGTLNVYPPANVAFSGLEIARGGAKQDVFKLLNPGVNGIQTLNGGGSNLDKIEFQRNANVTLTSSKLMVGGLATAQTFSFASIESAKLTGGAGNNIFDASGFNGPTYMRGGSGNDILIGSNFSDNLIGDGGDDWLSGNGGRDYLQGDGGRDILVGGQGNANDLQPELLKSILDDDILIGGRTAFDKDKTAILAILASWSSALTYNARIE
jgi:Ca2+-binding RTX toxin-like protein